MANSSLWRALCWSLLVFPTITTTTAQYYPAKSGRSARPDCTDSLYRAFVRGTSEQRRQVLELATTDPANNHTCFFRPLHLLNKLERKCHNSSELADWLPEVQFKKTIFFSYNGLAKEAFELFVAVEKFYEQKRQYARLANVNFSLANAFYASGDHDNAIRYAGKGIENWVQSADEHQNYRALINALNMCGIIARKRKQYHTALFEMKRALQYAELARDSAWIGITKGNIGLVYFSMGDYSNALPYLEADIRTSLATGQLTSALNAESMILLLHLRSGNTQQARSHLRNINELIPHINDSLDLSDAYRALAEYYEWQGDYQKALSYTKYLIDVFESERTKINEGRVGRLRAFFDYYNLSQEKLRQEYKLEQYQYLAVYILVVAAALLVLIVVVTRYLIRYRNLVGTIQQQNQQLTEQNNTMELQHRVIQQQNTELANASALRSQILSIIAHDLRNPIGGLKGMLDLYRTGDIEAKDVQLNLDQLQRAVDTVHGTLEDLLVWASSQTGYDFKLEPVNFTLDKVLKDVFGLYQQQITKKELNCTISPQACEVSVVADYNQIAVVLRNVVSNAVKFTPAGGSIKADIRKGTSGCWLDIVDTGVGMNADYLERVLSPNVRTTRRGTSDETGTGLGLLLAHNFTTANGGVLHITSEPGKGTCVSVWLPSRPGATPPEVPTKNAMLAT